MNIEIGEQLRGIFQMRVLLCEENVKLALEIKRSIEAVEEKYMDEKVKIDVFYSVIDMYEYLERGDNLVDAVFLNMNLTYKSDGDGIKIAGQITNDYKNVCIIFYSEQLEFRQDIFDVEPLYVLKLPVIEKNMRTVMQKLSENVKLNRKECFVIKAVNALCKIRKDSVNYIESQGRYVRIYTNDEQILSINKIEQVMELLGEGFLQCHKSFGVNLNKVKKLEHSKIIMFDGTQIQISRKYQGIIKEALINSK